MNRRRHCAFVIGISLFLAPFFSCRANVYATNIKLNGSLTNSWVAPGYPAQISYILNEPATLGVQVKICLGTNVIKTLVATNGQPGALTGSNAFLWDGTDSHGSNVAQGLYALQITAGAVGYADWTNITNEGANFEVDYPRGLDVNRNTNSPYYGRVFVANDGGSEPVDVFKFNADGNPADEGEFGTDGYPWAPGNKFSPWKIAIGANDAVYVNDWSGPGVVLEFNQLIDTNYLIAFARDAYPTNESVNLSGPFVSGHATNEQLWMVDFEPMSSSLGVLRWDTLPDGSVNFGDTDVSYVIGTTNSDLGNFPYDVAVTTNGLIYTIECTPGTNEADNRIYCFPQWTNGFAPETEALWEIGAGDTNLINASGVAVNASGALVAVAVRGDGAGNVNTFVGGNLSLFSALDGSLVKRFHYATPFPPTEDEFIDVAWDNVGNVYALDIEASTCRVYSPPGTNQATTVCVANIEALSRLQPPQLAQALMTTNGESFMLEGQSDVTYVVQLSTNLVDWSDVATNFDSVPDRFISLPTTTDAQDFYRAVALPNR